VKTKTLPRTIRKTVADHVLSNTIRVIELPLDLSKLMPEGIGITYNIQFKVVEHLNSKNFELENKSLDVDIFKRVIDNTGSIPTDNQYQIESIKNVPFDDSQSLKELFKKLDGAIRPFIYIEFIENLDSKRLNKVARDNPLLLRMRTLLRK
jgi:hypothetical protein